MKPGSKDRQREKEKAKVRRAVDHPERPGEDCRAPAGKWMPVVAVSKCEGKSDCVIVCPYRVFEVGPIPEEQYRALPLPIRVKLWVHGKKTAFTPRADRCQACGLCVVACPEKAITLVLSPPGEGASEG